MFITFDPALREGREGEPARARNSDIVEDLGLVEYVFSDKTGTLTSNEMQLRAVAVKDAAFGGLKTRCGGRAYCNNPTGLRVKGFHLIASGCHEYAAASRLGMRRGDGLTGFETVGGEITVGFQEIIYIRDCGGAALRAGVGNPCGKLVRSRQGVSDVQCGMPEQMLGGQRRSQLGGLLDSALADTARKAGVPCAF